MDVGEADGELEVGALLADPVLEDAVDTKEATGGPGKIYWMGVSKMVGS